MGAELGPPGVQIWFPPGISHITTRRGAAWRSQLGFRGRVGDTHDTKCPIFCVQFSLKLGFLWDFSYNSPLRHNFRLQVWDTPDTKCPIFFVEYSLKSYPLLGFFIYSSASSCKCQGEELKSSSSRPNQYFSVLLRVRY